jgi:predicted nucleic-acid-binding protein
VVRALRAFQHGKGGFADYLIGSRARDEGCSRVLTFDRALLTEAGFESP